MEKPLTRREDVVEKIHNVDVVDSYRWLEDGDAVEVKAWSRAQNEYTTGEIHGKAYELFKKELTDNFHHVSFTNPLPVQGRYFYRERQPGEDQMVLYVKDGLAGTPRILVNPNGKKSGNTVSLDFWQQSRSGKLLAYGLSEGGTEMSTLFVKNVDTGEDLKERILNCRYSNITWLPDDTGFFYTRNARPGTVPKNEEHLHVKVYLHILGQDSDLDELIFGADRPMDDMVGITLSLDGRILLISATQNWTANELFVYERDSRRMSPLVVGMQAKFGVKLLADKILLHTNFRANNYRVLTATYETMRRPVEEWDEFISEKEQVLESLSASKDKIFAEYLINASSKVVEYDYAGREVGEIPLPPFSTLSGISARREESEFFYSVESYTFPSISYRFDPGEKTYVLYRTTDNPIDPFHFTIRQEWCVSKDGTQFPLFIVHKKNLVLDGVNPTVLTAYGGFASSQTPGFLRNWISWISRGGVFAVANIRGGSEFGESWHLGATKEHKQKSYDDFIAAGKHLISNSYTNNDHLGIIGGSNGGLLVAAVAMQKPDLFRAVCSKVPLIDMVRFPRFGMASRWVHEYGDPTDEKEFQNILAWSPYHNVHDGVRYPDFLFTTGEKDSRVDPLHARKMTALLQEKSSGATYLFTEMDAGHGAGKPVSKAVESQALVLTFFAKTLGLKNLQ